jgi:Family of unknown function (DUF5989)
MPGCGGSSLTKNGYLERLANRRAKHDLRQLVIFGLVLGWGLLLIGAAKFFFTVGAIATLWLVAMAAGVVILGVAVIAPTLLRPLERGWMAVGTKIGHLILSAILLVVYFTSFAAIGAYMRRTRGLHPFYAWSSADFSGHEGWVPKELSSLPIDVNDQKRATIFQLVRVMNYFVRHGKMIYIPTLIVLLTLGILLFFLQTSALAPFIYTLF